jgi:hypothetical protein
VFQWCGRVLVTAAMAACCSLVSGEPPAEEVSAPAARALPGLTAPDQFPRGCVDCHVDRPDLGMDVRLSTQMRQWEVAVEAGFLERVRAFTPADMRLDGRHPKVEGTGGEIPASCLVCHAAKSKEAPPFGRLLHGLHYAGGAENHFVSLFGGECLHCHKLDPATAVWSLGSGEEDAP